MVYASIFFKMPPQLDRVWKNWAHYTMWMYSIILNMSIDYYRLTRGQISQKNTYEIESNIGWLNKRGKNHHGDFVFPITGSSKDQQQRNSLNQLNFGRHISKWFTSINLDTNANHPPNQISTAWQFREKKNSTINIQSDLWNNLNANDGSVKSKKVLTTQPSTHSFLLLYSSSFHFPIISSSSFYFNSHGFCYIDSLFVDVIISGSYVSSNVFSIEILVHREI